MIWPLVQTAYAQVSGSAVAGETESQLQGLYDFFIVKIPSFIAAFVVFVLFFFIAKAIKGIVENKMSQKFEEHKEMQILAGRTASTTTLILGATIALNIAGIDLTVIIAAAGFGIGFALKDIIINFLAGVFTLAQKQYTIGDYIQVNDTVGQVKEIQARATILQALDGTRVIVPNAELFTKQVISFTSNPFRRIEVEVGVEYATDLNLALRTCYEALKHTEGILIEPKPAVLTMAFGESSIDLVVRGWVESRGPWLAIQSALSVQIKKEFDKVGISIPFPIRTLVYDKDAQAEKENYQVPEWVKDAPKPAAQPVAQPQLQPAPVAVEANPVPVAPEVKPRAQVSPKDQPGTEFMKQ
ncbi:mechanosensitive ion channel domain-containing protein [Patescibacteria group bacterium]